MTGPSPPAHFLQMSPMAPPLLLAPHSRRWRRNAAAPLPHCCRLTTDGANAVAILRPLLPSAAGAPLADATRRRRCAAGLPAPMALALAL